MANTGNTNGKQSSLYTQEFVESIDALNKVFTSAINAINAESVLLLTAIGNMPIEIIKYFESIKNLGNGGDKASIDAKAKELEQKSQNNISNAKNAVAETKKAVEAKTILNGEVKNPDLGDNPESKNLSEKDIILKYEQSITEALGNMAHNAVYFQQQVNVIGTAALTQTIAGINSLYFSGNEIVGAKKT